MRQARVMLVAALLTAAGCQHDLASRSATPVSSRTDPQQDFNGFLLGDTRNVALNFQPPPVHDDIESDMVFGYISVPVHNGGLEYRSLGYGFGYSNTAVTLSKLIAKPKGSIPIWDESTPDESLVTWPAWRSYPGRPRGVVADEEPRVEPRFAAYASSLRSEVLRTGGRLAIDRGTDQRKNPAPLLADDD